ncbi:MAG: DUF5947 family protein [Candidatus Dormibacteria bacterium]
MTPEETPTVSETVVEPSLAVLKRFMSKRAPAVSCELCAAPVAEHPHHEHLFDPAVRNLLCSCTPCALLFPADADRKYLRVARRLFALSGFTMSDLQWESLAIPVGMAFVHRTRDGGVGALYPSPAGPTESLLPLEGWAELVEANPILDRLEPEVEALLINRVGARRDYYIAPIDRCYELVGLIRVSWRGLSGGHEVWERIDEFFGTLAATADAREAANA